MTWLLVGEFRRMGRKCNVFSPFIAIYFPSGGVSGLGRAGNVFDLARTAAIPLLPKDPLGNQLKLSLM